MVQALGNEKWTHHTNLDKLDCDKPQFVSKITIFACDICNKNITVIININNHGY